MCISITISHWTRRGSAIIGFSATDGSRTVTGDQAWGWGGYGTPTDEEYKKDVTPYILGWFGKPESELCGYIPSCVPSWTCEVLSNGYESDGCGNRRLNSLCNPGTVIPELSNIIIINAVIIIIIIILYVSFLKKG